MCWFILEEALGGKHKLNIFPVDKAAVFSDFDMHATHHTFL
jgi:hypothetical protein